MGHIRPSSILIMLMHFVKRKNNKEEQRISAFTSQEMDLELNSRKIKYMFMSRHQTTEQNHCRKAPNKCSEYVQVCGKDSDKSELNSRRR